jgi:outer membrane protein
MVSLFRMLLTVTVCVVCIPPASLFAAETKRLSLGDCISIGISNNLDIKIARIEAQSSGQDVLITESLFDTLATASASYTDDRRAVSSVFLGSDSITTDYALSFAKTLPTGTEIGVDWSNTRSWTNQPSYVTSNPFHDAEISFSLTQPVVKNIFGYVDQKRVRIAQITARIEDIRAFDRIENAIADIEKAYWRLAFEQMNVALKEQLLEQAQKLHELFEEHLRTGIAEQTELLETEANVRIRKTELEIAKNSLITAGNLLKLLLNETGDYLVESVDALEILDEKADRTGSLKEGFSGSRLYQMKKKELASKKIAVKMKKNSLWPEIDLVGTLTVNGIDRKFAKANRRLTTTKFPQYYAGIEFSMPLERSESRGEYNQALFEKKKAILELLQIEKGLATDIDSGVRAVNLGLENAHRRKKIREIQYAKFKEEEKKLGYGRSSGKTVIDYQRDYTLAAISEYQGLLDYYYALIDLENTKDTLLEKIGMGTS